MCVCAFPIGRQIPSATKSRLHCVIITYEHVGAIIGTTKTTKNKFAQRTENKIDFIGSSPCRRASPSEIVMLNEENGYWRRTYTLHKNRYAHRHEMQCNEQRAATTTKLLHNAGNRSSRIRPCYCHHAVRLNIMQMFAARVQSVFHCISTYRSVLCIQRVSE